VIFLQYYSNLTTKENYSGSSKETKPINGVQIGTRFEELDTGTMYVFDGTAWIVDPMASGSGSSGSTGTGTLSACQW
jgi:hypothetical protein